MPTRNPVMRVQEEPRIQRGESYSSIEASSPPTLKMGHKENFLGIHLVRARESRNL
jgi:hypothetical protein